MAISDKPRAASSPAPEAGQRAKGAPNDRAFNTWVQKQLHAMYDEIAGEPLPYDLLDLIDAAAIKDSDGGEAAPDSEK